MRSTTGIYRVTLAQQYQSFCKSGILPLCRLCWLFRTPVTNLSLGVQIATCTFLTSPQSALCIPTGFRTRCTTSIQRPLPSVHCWKWVTSPWCFYDYFDMSSQVMNRECQFEMRDHRLAQGRPVQRFGYDTPRTHGRFIKGAAMTCEYQSRG